MTLWLLGGIDPTGGAGLARDMWAARSIAPEQGVRGVVTAWTEQGVGRAVSTRAVEAERLDELLRGVETATALKAGLLPRPAATALGRLRPQTFVPWVVDPVLGPSQGGTFDVDVDMLLRLRHPQVLWTPNRHEAERVVGKTAGDDGWVDEVARMFAPSPVLIKSARLSADKVTDILIIGSARHQYTRPRLDGPDPRGTGCALATAIACGVASGATWTVAIERAVRWLDVARQHVQPAADGRIHFCELAPSLERD